MEARGRQFDIEIERTVMPDALFLPSSKELESETLGGNRDYISIDVDGWNEVALLIQQEDRIIDRICTAGDIEEALEDWQEENFEDPALLGFDLGTNALTAALVAASCLPFYSCNGGAFGGHHNDAYPLVVFFCPKEVFRLVEAAAETAGTGLECSHVGGGVTTYEPNIDSLISMARAQYGRRREIEATLV